MWMVYISLCKLITTHKLKLTPCNAMLHKVKLFTQEAITATNGYYQ